MKVLQLMDSSAIWLGKRESHVSSTVNDCYTELNDYYN